MIASIFFIEFSWCYVFFLINSLKLVFVLYKKGWNILISGSECLKVKWDHYDITGAKHAQNGNTRIWDILASLV